MRNKELAEEVNEVLFSKDTKEVYERFKQLELICDTSNELYQFFDSYLQALQSEKSCVRGRGFKLAARNAKWDKENKINNSFTQILAVLDDEKPTVVRQCLAVVDNIGKYKKELIPAISKKLKELDYLKYKESMQGLIKKDIENALNKLNEY